MPLPSQVMSIALHLVRSQNNLSAPTIASRFYHLVAQAMWDAHAYYDLTAVPLRPQPTTTPLYPQGTERDKAVAVATAAHLVLDRYKLSANQVLIDGFREQYVPLDHPARPVGIAAAQAVLNWADLDGSNEANGYADLSSYVPVNTYTLRPDPSRWVPLLGQSFATPHWGSLQSFGLGDNRFLPPNPGVPISPGSPPQLDARWLREVRELITTSLSLTVEQKASAEYWSDGNGTGYPPGKWVSIAQTLAQESKLSFDEEVRLFALLTGALRDAAIACWFAKRSYDLARPITLVQDMLGTATIQGWARYRGAVPMSAQEWRPYLATPPFPGYTSGHSTFSWAAATVLSKFLETDKREVGWEAFAGSSTVEPGLTPPHPVRVQYPTLSAAARAAGESRLLGGIHLRMDLVEGEHLGKRVGEVAWAKYQQLLTGNNALTPANGNGVQVYAYSFSNTTPSPLLLLVPPPQSRILEVRVQILQPAGGAGASLTIGTALAPALYQTVTELQLQQAGVYSSYPNVETGAIPAQLRATITPAGRTFSGTITIFVS